MHNRSFIGVLQCICATLDFWELPVTKRTEFSKTGSWHCEWEGQTGLKVRKGETLSECFIPALSKRARPLSRHRPCMVTWSNLLWLDILFLLFMCFQAKHATILVQTPCCIRTPFCDRQRCCTLATNLSAPFHTGLCEDSHHNGASSLPGCFDY